MKEEARKKGATGSVLGLAWRAIQLSGLALAGFVPFAVASSHAHAGAEAFGAASPFAIADYDGDNRPDIARVLSSGTIDGENHYSIDFELTTGLKQRIVISAPLGGLRLVSRDVNGDNFPDVVVTAAWTGSPVAVLLNDGRGNFTRTDPSNFPGAFRTNGHSLGSPWNTRADRSALVARPLSGHCAGCEARHLVPDVFSRIPQSRPCFPSLAGRNAFLGRAPPSFGS